MKKKQKILAYSVLFPLLGAGLLAAGGASAFSGGMGMGMFGGVNASSTEELASRQQSMFAREATLLGVTVDEVKTAWAQGKNLQQLATEKGISADQLEKNIQADRVAQLKTQLQALVDKGVITQTQADQRLAFMQTQFASGKLGRHGRGHMGMGGGMMF